MRHFQSIRLVDPDSRRRAAITHRLSAERYRVDPFENIDELGDPWPSDGVILIYNEGRPIGALLERMTATGRWLPVIAFSEAPDAHRVVEAVLDGALDYLVWPFDREALDAALDWAGNCDNAIGNARLREARARSRLQRLTTREHEVLSGVTDGLSNRQIAQRLGISPRTVEIHRANMLNKIGARHTSEAIRVAIEAALIAA